MAPGLVKHWTISRSGAGRGWLRRNAPNAPKMVDIDGSAPSRGCFGGEINRHPQYGWLPGLGKQGSMSRGVGEAPGVVGLAAQKCTKPSKNGRNRWFVAVSRPVFGGKINHHLRYGWLPGLQNTGAGPYGMGESPWGGGGWVWPRRNVPNPPKNGRKRWFGAFSWLFLA